LSLTSRRGFSLIEVLIGVILLSAALMGLAGAASAGLMQSTRSRDDTQFWGDAQTILDSLVARPYGTAATTDSTTVRRRKIKWVIASPATAPQKITLIVWRRGYQLTRQNVASRAVPDTVVFYLARRVPGS
jgi:prepilin-type N-terminal cleavage/methylation domain-containing protein